MTSKDMTNAISSPESEDGATRSDSPDGPMTDLFGQPVVLAHRSPSPESKRSAQLAKARVLSGALEELASQYALTANTLGLPMPATYGRKFGDSQLNLDLDAYSENRLTVWEHSRGSPLYQHHLKFSATPLGRRVCRLQASARPIFDNDCGGLAGWETPTATPGARSEAFRKGRVSLNPLECLAGWPTPRVSDIAAARSSDMAAGRDMNRGFGAQLSDLVTMAGWPTPKVSDDNQDRRTMDSTLREWNRKGASRSSLPLVAKMAGWPTPCASDATMTLEQALKEAVRKGPTNNLGTCAALTGWATPKILGRQVNLSPAMTAKRGVLNPAFSLWLMGYPKHWMAVAPSRASASLGARAMQSFPNAQPDLSEPGSDT